MHDYFVHLAHNWRVASRSLVMFFFHFIHGLIPVKVTEHEFWGFDDNSKEMEE